MGTNCEDCGAGFTEKNPRAQILVYLCRECANKVARAWKWEKPGEELDRRLYQGYREEIYPNVEIWPKR